jgi:uncharacterized protein YjdB
MSFVKKFLGVFMSLCLLFTTISIGWGHIDALAITTLTTAANKTYYFSTSGSTSNTALASSSPWPVANINTTTFKSGDSVLIKCGDTYTGTLNPLGSGTSGHPIILSSYTGSDGLTARPIIDGSATTNAFTLTNQQYWLIENLEIKGGSARGIYIQNTGTTTLNNIHVVNCVVHDVTGSFTSSNVNKDIDYGLISITSNRASSVNAIFNDVLVDHCTCYNNSTWGGIYIAGYNGDAIATVGKNTNVTVRNCNVYNVSGDGILVATANNVLIDHCVAHDIGEQTNTFVATPNAIWTWYTDNATVQYCEAYNTHSASGDGGAFDIDYLNTNNIVQYCYAHDCDAYAISVFGASGATTSNSIIRYNVFSNCDKSSDAIVYGYADIKLTTWALGYLNGVQIYNNTIYSNPANLNPAFSDVDAAYTGSNSNFFKNNIIYSNTANMLDARSGQMTFNNNLYFNASEASSKVSFRYNDITYSSFAAFQAKTGQDANSINADPGLNNPTYHSIGASTTAFTLKSGSAALGKGAVVSTAMGSYDFFANTLPTTHNIGAYEGIGSTLSTSTTDVSSIALDKATLSLDVGGTKPLKATISPDTATNSQVAWVSSNPVVATVDSTGIVTGVAPGTATITAACAANGDLTAVCTVTVSKLTKIEDTISDYEQMYSHTDGWLLAVGHLVPYESLTPITAQSFTYRLADIGNFQFGVQYYMWDQLYTDYHDSSWAFGETEIKNLIATNILTNSTAYNYKFKAYISSDGNTFTQIDVTTTYISNDGLYFYVYYSPTNSLPAGTKYVKFEIYDNDQQWTTAPDYAHIYGTTVTLNKSSLTMNASDTVQLTATVDPTFVGDTSVTWVSSNTSVATVDTNGLVTAIGGGSATITAVSNYSGSVTAACVVKVAPVITIDPYITTPTNQDITVSATTDSGTLNAASHTFTENGSFDFVATDDAGNSTTSTVTINNIDKTAPVITIDPYITTPTNQDITVTATTEAGTLNAANHTFTENGSFNFVASDDAGNITTNTVTIKNIDKTAPVVTIDPYITTPTNQDITVTAKTDSGVLNAASHTFTENGSFDFVATDDAGNSTTSTVTISNIDKTVPVVTITQDTTSPTNGNVTVTITASEDAAIQYSFDNGAAWNDYTSPLTITENKTIIAKATDLVGNTSENGLLMISNIDKTPPSITASVKNGGYTFLSVSVACSDANLDTKSATRNGGSITWPSNNIFTLDGIYDITATDKAGNQSTYSFAIDKNAPVISAIKMDGACVGNKGFANTDVTVTVSDSALKIKCVILNGRIVSWPSNNTFASEGKYVVIACDKYFRITLFTFTIDKTAPKITVENLCGKVITNGSNSKSGATFNCSDTNLFTKSITLNGKAISWPSSNKVTKVGIYLITVTDKAGNESSFTFTVV